MQVPLSLSHLFPTIFSDKQPSFVGHPTARRYTSTFSSYKKRAKSFPPKRKKEETMEGLRELEQAQKMVSLIQANNLSSNDHDSDRFLADFLLFMVKSRGTLDMETKYNLISENLPKISPAFLEEAMTCVDVQDQIVNAQPPTAVSFPDKSHFVSSETSMPMSGSDDMPMIGLDSMQRANSTLEDFCRSYFMFHGMDVQRPESVFKYLPILSFTEGYIYQLDTLNEEILSISQNIDSGSISKAEKSRKLADDVVEVFESGAFRPLIILLEHHSLLTNRIREELSCGEEYWALERKLCHALISRKEILIEDVMKAIHLKSFDYRVLNLLLYQLRKSQVNEMHMEFLSISEFLVEISDDLFDYEEDVIENNFNILRMFVGVYGASVAPVMLAKCITEAEEKYENLLKALDPELSVNYRRRCEEATKEGGSRAGTSLGTWSIPPVIGNEEFYRSECINPDLNVSNSV